MLIDIVRIHRAKKHLSIYVELFGRTFYVAV